MKVFYIIYFASMSFSGLSINPEKEYKYFPKDFGINNSEFFLKTEDGYKIIVWEFIPDKNNNNKVIIISGGDAGNMSYSLFYVKKLLSKGYTILTYDYRGFGKSDPFEVDKNYLYRNEYSKDLSAVLTYTQNKFGSHSKIGFMAFSMGTIVGVSVLLKEDVDFFIAEDFVYNPVEVVSRLTKQRGKNYLLPKPMVDFKKAINEIHCPMLLFAGEKDEITKISDSRKIVESVSNRKLIVHNKGHAEAAVALTGENTGDIYFEEVNRFLISI